MAWDENLRGNALEIASNTDNLLRVVAGPGTGKTFALMRRVSRLLEEGIDPTSILLVTFTRVAANDLENEINKLKIVGASTIRKGTLHSFCFSTLSQRNVLNLTGRHPRPLLNYEERFLLEDLGGDFGTIHERKRQVKAFEAAWAREQEQAPGWPLSEEDQRFQASLYEWLGFHRAILLGELVPITLRYIRNNPGCEERTQFEHVLVDEYQDLNRAEQSLLDLLSENGSLSVIGDEDQSIYESFRYAHPEGISEFSQTHDGTHDVPLELCRRCPTTVVSMANSLIQNNIRREGRILEPMEGNPEGEVHVVQWSDIQHEAEGLANFLQTKISSGEFDPSEILILSPRRQFGYAIRDELRNRDIPAHSFFHEEVLDGNPKILNSSEAQQAFTLLTLLRNIDDRVAFRCWLGFGSQNLRSGEYQRLLEYCSLNNISPRETLMQISNNQINIPYTRGIVERFSLLQEQLNELSDLHAPDVFSRIFPPEEEWAVPIRNMVEASITEWSIENIYDILLTNISQPELPTDVEYVRIMSLHKSKGLTAQHVIVTGLIEGIIPSRNNDELSFEEQRRLLEEQRRLFCVAITRPKRTLILSSVLTLSRQLAHKIGAIVGQGNRDTVETITSNFLSELGPDCPISIFGEDW